MKKMFSSLLIFFMCFNLFTTMLPSMEVHAASEAFLVELQPELEHYTLCLGSTQQTVVHAVYSDYSEKDVTADSKFESYNPSIASVNSNGIITANALGETIIVITCGGKATSVKVKVTKDVFLKGTYLELGVSSSGSFGTESKAPEGFHPIGTPGIGMMVDSDGFDTGNAPTTGDFFLPGTPEEGFTVGYRSGSITGTINTYTNVERSYEIDIPSTSVNISSGETLAAKTDGMTRDGKLKMKQIIMFLKDNKFFKNTVTLTNVSSETQYDVRYMRSLDPDQDATLKSEFDTLNTVLKNPTTDDSAMVRATGPVSGDSMFFVAYDNRARASSYGFLNRNPYNSNVYNTNGSALLKSEHLDDEAIAMTFALGDLEPGQSVTFCYYTSLNPDFSSGLNEINNSLTGISLDSYNYNLEIGNTHNTVVSAVYGDNTEKDMTDIATFTSSNPLVATVDSTGLVKALKPGSTTITAAYQDWSADVTVTVPQPAIFEVSLDSMKYSLPVGITHNTIVTATFAEHSSANVTSDGVFSSSDPSILGVSPTGVVTGIKEGIAVINVQYAEQTFTVEVTVTPPVLAGIVLDSNSFSLDIGSTHNTVVTAVYSNSNTYNVTSNASYTSSIPTVASVTSDGVIQGLTTGSTTITATYGEKTASAVVSVTTPSVIAIRADADSYSLSLGNIHNTIVYEDYSNGSSKVITDTSTFSSSDPSIASVSPSGAVKGLKAGSTVIQITGSGHATTVNVNVTPAELSGIILDASSYTLPVKSDHNTVVTAVYADGVKYNVTEFSAFSSSDPYIVQVDPLGKVTGMHKGNATVTAYYKGKEVSAVITVPAPLITGISLHMDNSSIPVGVEETVQIEAAYSDDTNEALTNYIWYTSSNPLVAPVSPSGTITGISVGEATITATYGNYSISQIVNIIPPVIKQIILDSSAYSLITGQTHSTVVTAVYTDGKKLNITDKAAFNSSDPHVTTVDSKGIVEAITSGNVIITISIGNISSSCSVNVSQSSPAGAFVIPNMPVDDNKVKILVNGKEEVGAIKSLKTEYDRKYTMVTLDDKIIQDKLKSEEENATITIPITGDSDVYTGIINGQTLMNMQSKESTLELRTDNVRYAVPSSLINIDSLLEQLGNEENLSDIKVNISISKSANDTAAIIRDTANKNGYQVVVPPVDFQINCTSRNKAVEISKFKGYVERMVAIEDGIDPSRITTGVVLNSDGTFTHVPTTIVQIDGKYYARINSLTNSTYSVIWSPKTFVDMEDHWAKADVNDMGSRLIISGVSPDTFSPDTDITRSEFAAILVRSLGLMRNNVGKDVFNDVKNEAWYYDAVSIAKEYGLIEGNGDGLFEPEDMITREEAMALTSRALKIINVDAAAVPAQAVQTLEKFNDASYVSDWAVESVSECIKNDITKGDNGYINPKSNIKRTETAAMIRRMLSKAGLIN